MGEEAIGELDEGLSPPVTGAIAKFEWTLTACAVFEVTIYGEE
jgi:hypothetical protein